MATANLKVILDVLYKGGAGLKNAQRDLQNIDTAAKGGIERWKQYGVALAGIGAAFGTVAIAGRELYQALGEGAELEKARDQFDRLSESIGSTGDALMVSLKDATRGMMSDAELVASAGQVMSLGLADTKESVTDLINVAGQLGWNMDMVTLTLANNSVMRLDALGLSIDSVKTKAAALEAQGFDADKAFDLAVIEAGKEKIDLLGNAADTTAGKMKVFESAVKNVQDEFNLELAVAFGDALGDSATAARDGAAALEEYAGKLGNLIGGLLGAGVDKVPELTQLLSMNPGDAARLWLDYYGVVQTGYEKTFLEFIRNRNLLDEIFRPQKMAGAGDHWEQLSKHIESSGKMAQSAAPNFFMLKDSIDQTNAAASGAATAADGFAGSVMNINEVFTREGRIRAYAEAMGGLAGAAGAAESAIDRLNSELDELNGKNLEGSSNVRRAEYYTGDFTNTQPSPIGPGEAPLNTSGGGGTPLPAPPKQIPQGATSVTVNNYNEKATAMTMAMMDLQRVNKISARMQ